MQRFIPALIGIFLIAQLSGAAPLSAGAQPSAPSSVAHIHQHDASLSNQNAVHDHYGDQDVNFADQCCALHSLTGVIIPVATAVPIDEFGKPILEMSALNSGGIGPSLLERPPRSLLSL